MKQHIDFVETTDPDSTSTDLVHDILPQKTLILASNRGPISFHPSEKSDPQYQLGDTGIVTALINILQHVDVRWVACAYTEEDKAWGEGLVSLGVGGEMAHVQFVCPSEAAHTGYSGVISNPLLWFLQHSMWNIFREPTIDQTVWRHWEEGYVAVNMLFAEAIAQQITSSLQPALVMLQNYHLYLAPKFIRYKFHPEGKYTLAHFVHIPWPGAEDWGFLPAKMRRAILEGLCAVDLLGFQTREDGLNFIRTCESHLPDCQVHYGQGKLWFRNHTTYIRDFPVSIDVDGLRQFADSVEVNLYRGELQDLHGDWQIMLRIDHIEPSTNIVRGFKAFDELLELYPEHRGKVKFVALLMPSRLEIDEYEDYLNEVMSIAGRVNAKYGGHGWEPIRILVDENHPRAVAGLQIYDVLLVNSITNGMNLVAKAGPMVNRRNGVLVLSEHSGAYQQLESGALPVSPLDIHGTAAAMHKALTMSMEERRKRAERLRSIIERHDIGDWLNQQLRAIVQLKI